MELIYKQAGPEDLERLVEARAVVLRAANGLPDDADMEEVKAQSRRYYQKALGDGSHIARLVLHGERLVGTGGVSFYEIMPTYHNPGGRKAYLMNLYTAPACRRRGIAWKTLDLLVQDCLSRGVTAISLEATSMGRPLYQRYGFVPMENEMELPPERFPIL